MTEHTNSYLARLGNLLLFAIAVGLVLFVPPLTMELGLDELGSYWVIKDGFWQVIDRSVHIQGQSPLYYIFLWLCSKGFGVSALALRSFSVVCTLCSCLLVFQLGRLLFDRKIGTYAVVGFVCCSQVIESATAARPYALAITLSLAASIALVTWCRQLTTKWLLAYACLITATIYAHYLFALSAVIHGLFILLRLRELSAPQRSTLIKQTIVLVFVSAISLAPNVFQLQILAAKGARLSFAEFPSLLMLIKTLIPMEILLMVSLILAFRFTVWRKSNLNLCFNKPSQGGAYILTFLWLLLPPLLVYAVSLITGHSLFIERYYAARVIGIALLCGIIVDSLNSARNRIVILVCFVLVSAIIQYPFKGGESLKEGWRAAAATIAKDAPTNSCSVLLLSGFIESQTVRWLLDEMISDFIRAPLTYYKVTNRAVSLPYTFDTTEGTDYYTSALVPELQHSNCIWLLYRNAELFVSNQKLPPSPLFLQVQIPRNGFHVSLSEQFGIVELIKFERG